MLVLLHPRVQTLCRDCKIGVGLRDAKGHKQPTNPSSYYPSFLNLSNGRTRFPRLPPRNNTTDSSLIPDYTRKFYKVPARVQTSCLNSLKMNTPDNPLDCSRWVDSPERTVAESLSWTSQVLKKPKLTYVKFSRHFSGRFIRASIYSHCVPRHFRYIVVVDSLNSFVVNYTTCDSIYQPPSKICFQLRQ